MMSTANTFKMGGVIALLASILAIAPTASALSYTFSFSNENGSVPGTVQGTFDLPDGDGINIAATSLFVTSAPALGYTLPFDASAIFPNVFVNSFQVVGGNIVLAGSSLGIQNATSALALNVSNGSAGSLLTISGSGNISLGVQDLDSSTLIFSPATPIPFEFNPALGIGLLGAAWFGHRVIKKAKSKDI